MFRSRLSLLATLSPVLVMSACGLVPPKIELSEFPEDTTSLMDRAARAPTTIKNDRLRAIVLRTEQSAGGANQPDKELNEAFTREVESMLGVNGVEIVDRSLADKLDQEIKACEMQGRGVCSSAMQPSVAQFAVKPSLTNATYVSTFISPQRATGGDGMFLIMSSKYPGYVDRIPVDGKNDILIVRPHFEHVANVSTSVKVYEIPSLREVKAVAGTSSQTERSADRADFRGKLLVGSLKGALNTGDSREQLLNVFAPKGYVIGRRSAGKKVIFRISMGAAQGVVAGANVVIYSEQETENPLNGQKTIDLIDVVKGKVSTLVLPNEAWIVPDDDEKAAKVTIGDQVQVKHEANFMKRFQQQLVQ
jgi:hypothetical protein